MGERIMGRDTLAAYKAASVWATPVACGAGDGFEIAGEGLSSEVALARDESFNGSPVPYPGKPGNETVGGTLTVNLKYEDVTLLILAQLAGIAGAPTGAAAPYTHTLQLAPSNDGLFGTLCLGRGTYEVWEYGNVKPRSFEIAASLSDEFVKATIDFGGYTRKINTSSGTNTNTTFEDVTIVYPGGDKLLVSPGELTVLMNDQADAALDAGDAVCVESFSLKFERRSEEERTTCSAGKLAEPLDNDFIVVQGKLVIPAYEDGMRSLVEDAAAKVVKKMRWVFTNASEDPAANGEVLQFDFPAVQLTVEGPAASGAGKMPVTINFEAGLRASGVVAGMAEDIPFITIKNALATDMLA